MPDVPGRWGSVDDPVAAPFSEGLLPSLEPGLGVSRAISGLVLEKKPIRGGCFPFFLLFFKFLERDLVFLFKVSAMIGWYYDVADSPRFWPKLWGGRIGVSGGAGWDVVSVNLVAPCYGRGNR